MTIPIEVNNQKAKVNLREKKITFKNPRIVKYVLDDKDLEEIKEIIQPLVQKYIQEKIEGI